MAVEDVLAAAKCFVCRLLPYFSAYSAVKLEATETMQPKLSKAATLHSFPPVLTPFRMPQLLCLIPGGRILVFGHLEAEISG